MFQPERSTGLKPPVISHDVEQGKNIKSCCPYCGKSFWWFTPITKDLPEKVRSNKSLQLLECPKCHKKLIHHKAKYETILNLLIYIPMTFMFLNSNFFHIQIIRPFIVLYLSILIIIMVIFRFKNRRRETLEKLDS